MLHKWFNTKLQSRSLLSNKIFMRLFSAYATASFGDWFDAIAIQVLLVYRWGVTPMTLALVPVAMALPGLLLGSLAGTIADRVPKVRLMFLCDLLSAVLTLCLLVAPSIYWIIPVLMLRSAVSTFVMPAQQAMTRQVVKEEELLQATSINGLVNQLSKIAGPLLGGVILAMFTPQICILIGAAGRIASCAMLWTVRHASDDVKKTIPVSNAYTEVVQSEEGYIRRGTVWQEWKEGWKYLLQRRVLLHTMIYCFFGLTALLMVDYQFTVLLREIAPNNESMLGILVAAIGLGAVIVLLIVNRQEHIGYRFGLGTGAMGIGLGIAGLGLVPSGSSSWMITGLALVIGLGNGLYMVTNQTIMQKESSTEMVGRVFGISNTLVSVALVTAPLAGGAIIELAGVKSAFFGIGFIVAMIGLIGLLFGKKWWGVQHMRSEDQHESKQAAIQ
ncbi:MFS transporter [Paenibacillus urinalis]|uniref:MFS transporter n=1 Tax=Paenibacillus urinalis TaxID=521520 RepID=A0ABY7X8V5_9BACL|nr:MFS transporter [Paenibacillus urinalis]WDH98547.1 MFS transporter [Paenibacillus urinalis]WDI02239.1 MFS transporter [Paenibacillus urinalis]